MSVLLNYTDYRKMVRAYLAIIFLLGLSISANAQSPVAKGNARIIDKSRLTIHENLREAQPQRFNNSRSKIETYSSNAKPISKTRPSKNTSIHTRANPVAAKHDATVKQVKRAAKARALRHHLKRKSRKVH